ncbi:MAG: nuclear transport factor 2 family protein [Balneola sp.]
MLRFSILPILLFFLINGIHNPEQELDQFWDEASRTVKEGDFKGYSDTFHSDAVLVNGISENSYPIAEALEGWKKGFEDTKAGKMKASVEFRFSKRFHSETTAYETGMFKYSSQQEGAQESTVYIHLEALLIKADRKWKILMEHQVSVGTKEQWNSLK